MTASNTDFRTLGMAESIPNDFVVPFYLEDLKRRISIARCRPAVLRVRRPLHLRPGGLAALQRPANRQNDYVPMPRFALRHNNGSRNQWASDCRAQEVHRAGG